MSREALSYLHFLDEEIETQRVNLSDALQLVWGNVLALKLRPPMLCLCACVLSSFSHDQLFATLWTVALQAPLSMGFSRQEYWGGGHFLLQCSVYGSSCLWQSWGRVSYSLGCTEVSWTKGFHGDSETSGRCRRSGWGLLQGPVQGRATRRVQPVWPQPLTKNRTHFIFKQGFLLYPYPCLWNYTLTPSPGVEETRNGLGYQSAVVGVA